MSATVILVYDEGILREQLLKILSPESTRLVIEAVRQQTAVLPDPGLGLKGRREAVLDHLTARVNKILNELQEDFQKLGKNFPEAVADLTRRTEASLTIIKETEFEEGERLRLRETSLLWKFFDLLRQFGFTYKPLTSLDEALTLTASLLPKMAMLVKIFEGLQSELEGLPGRVRDEVGEELLDLLGDPENQTALDLDLVLRILSEDGLVAEEFVELNRLPIVTRLRLVESLRIK